MTNRILVALAALIVASTAFAEQVYRWKDEEGQINYGEQPPEEVDAKPVGVETRSAKETGSKPSKGSSPEENAEQASQEDGVQVDEEYTQKKCQTARQAVKNLKEGGPDARYSNDNNEIVTYSKEEYQSRLKKNRDFVQRFCQGSNESQG